MATIPDNFDIFSLNCWLINHLTYGDKPVEKEPAKQAFEPPPSSSVSSITQAFSELTFAPSEKEDLQLSDKSVKQVFTERCVQESDNVKLREQNKELAVAACERAKKRLKSQGEFLNLEYVKHKGFALSTKDETNAFAMIEKALVVFASRATSWEDTFITELRQNVEDAHDSYTHRNSKGGYEKFKMFFNACLDEMDADLRANIADNIAKGLLWTYPKGRLNQIIYHSWDLNLIPIISAKTDHASLQQLFAAAYMGDREKLLKCLKAPDINPFVRNCAGDFFIHIACREHRAECVKMVFELGIFPKSMLSCLWSDLVSYLVSRNPLFSAEIVQLFLDYDIPPPPEKLDEIFKKIIDVRQDERWHLVITGMLDKFPNLQKKIQGSNRTIVEELYFEAVTNRTSEKLFCKMVPILREPFSELVLRDMEERIIASKEVKWILLLPRQRALDCCLILLKGPSQISEYIIELKRQTSALEKEMELHNLDPEAMCADVIVKAHSLKKEAKTLLKRPPLSTSASDLESLKNTYVEFEKMYDAAVERHPIFQMVRHLSRTIRKTAELDPTSKLVLMKFLNIKIGKAYDFREIWQKESLFIRRNIAKGYAEISQLPRSRQRLKILHGTNSAALPIIFRTGKKLQAAGKLLSQRMAPLSGELVAAKYGHNEKGISTILADTSWEQEPSSLAVNLGNIHGATRFGIAKSYSERAYQETFSGERPLLFDRQQVFEAFEKSCTLILTGKLKDHFQTFNAMKRKFFWFELTLAVIRLKMTGDKEFMERTAEVLTALKKLRQPAPELLECLEIWQLPPGIEIDPLDPLIVNKDPILLASTCFTPNEALKKAQVVEELAETGETVVYRDLVLGQDFDFDLVFTKAEAVARVQKAFDRAGVPIQALSFEAGHLLEMRQMSIGTRRLAASSIEKQSLHEMSFLLHKDVLPSYVTPFPKVPSYRQKDKLVIVKRPFFAEGIGSNHEAYLQAVKACEILARFIHGSMHSMRVCLFALMCYYMCLERGLKLEVALNFLLLAAARHDSERQDEGEDHWDEASAEKLAQVAQDQYGITDEKMIELLYNALKNKDPAEHPNGYESLFQRLVHEGDFWDFIRTLDDPKKQFKMKYSALACLPEFQDFPFEKLRDEIIVFIRLTENKSLKTFLERNSKNFLQDLVVIFEMLHEKCGFPLMMKYLKPVCSEFAGGSSISKEILAKILAN